LGISYEDLGIGIAQTWGFPNLIVNCMRKLPAGSVRKQANAEERLRVLSSFSNDLCKVIADATPEQRQKELRKVTARYSESIALSDQDLKQTVEKSFAEVSKFAGVIHLNLQQTPFGRQIKARSVEQVESATQSAAGIKGAESVKRAEISMGTDQNVAETVLSDTVLAGVAGDAPTSSEAGAVDTSGAAEAILMAGIQDISNTLVEDFKLNDVLRIILETMYRAKGFKRVILCIRDGRNNTMLGRFGFGPDAQEKAKRFNFSLAFTPDIFHAALSKNVDILISDTNDAKISTRIPEWFRKGVGAETFVIFPLCIKGNPVALIYADCDHAGEIVIPEKELSLLRTLRNQAVLAIKQST
jgi:hypothetical protein